MNKKRLVKDVLVAFLAQGVALLVSVLTTLLAPKVLGVEGYGYWQLFLFYGTYVGLFQFGVIDGLYLICGGKTRDEIDKESVSFSFRFVVVSQTIVGCVLAFIVAPFMPDVSRGFVVAFVGLYTLLSNATNFFSYLFQTMNETRRSSLVTLVDRTCFLLALLVLFVLRTDDFRPFIVVCLASRVIACGFGVFLGKDVCFVRCPDFKRGCRFLFETIKVGVILVLANLADQLVIGSVRASVDGHWGIEVFSVVSLSFSMVSFVMTFVSQVSMVLFPALRRVSDEGLNRFYRVAKSGLFLALPIVYVLYCPLALFIGAWLPDYSASIGYLALLMPVCVFDAQMNICGTTVLKVTRREKQLLGINIMAILLAAVGALIGSLVFNNIELTLLSALVAIAVRCYTADYTLRSEFGGINVPLAVGELVLALLFVVCSLTFGFMVSFVVSLAAYGVFLFLNRKNLSTIVHELRS